MTADLLWLGADGNPIDGGSAPTDRATTIITSTEDGEQEYNITGTLDRQWFIANGYYDGKNYEWLKTITQVDIGNAVTSIGMGAIGSCSDLTSVTIPNSVTSIEEMAFDSCSSLTNVTIPGSVTSLGPDVFANCSSLTNVTFQGKTLEQVQAMQFYPWGINTSVINVA